MKVTLGIFNDDAEHFFPSKVEDVLTDHIILGMPMKQGRIYYIEKGEKINIYFPFKTSFYCMEGLVEGKQYEPIPVIIVRPIGEPCKKQNRNYFRLNIALKAYIKLPDCKNPIKVYTKDISAGGVKFSSSLFIKEGTLTEIMIPEILDDLWLRAIIVRTEKNYQAQHPNKYYIAAQFTEIDEYAQDAIAKFIFSTQRKLIRKGIK